MSNRIRRAIANRAAFGRRMGFSASNISRRGVPQYRRQQYRNMGLGIRRLAGTIIANRVARYIRK